MDEARFEVDVRVDEDVLHEVYLPHFRRAARDPSRRCRLWQALRTGLRNEVVDGTSVLPLRDDGRLRVALVGPSSRDEGESFTPDSDGAPRLLGAPTRSGPVRRVIAAILRAAAERMGAGGDRRGLHLHDRDVRLVREVAAGNARMLVV